MRKALPNSQSSFLTEALANVASPPLFVGTAPLPGLVPRRSRVCVSRVWGGIGAQLNIIRLPPATYIHRYFHKTLPHTALVLTPFLSFSARTSVSLKERRDPRRRSSMPSLPKIGMMSRHHPCSLPLSVARPSSPAPREPVSHAPFPKKN